MVKVVAWTFTQDAYKHGRDEWLRRVVTALGEADEVLVFDHHSEDGSPELVSSLGGVCWSHADRNRTIGRAMNLGHQAAAVAAGEGGVVVTAQDDVVWRPGWRDRLEAFWEDAPADIGMIGDIGRQQQQQAQAGLDVAYANQFQQAMAPMQQLAFYSDIITGAPSGQTAIQTRPGPSVASQYVGGATTLSQLPKILGFGQD